MSGRGGDAVPELLLTLTITVVTAAVIGVGLGWLLEQLVRRHAIPDFLHGVTFLAAAVGSLVASNAIQPESGLLTVTVLGVYLGNRPELHLGHVSEFKEHLQVLFVGVLFVVLAGRIGPDQLGEVAPRAAVFVALLVLVVRPVSVVVGLWGTGATRQEKGLLACMAPRGIVAAAVISIFGLEFAHAAEREDDPAVAARLEVLAAQATDLVPLVFLVIVSTVALYGLGVGRLAERLGLATTSPQGVLFVGGQGWVVDAAKALEDADVPTLLVSRDYQELAAARMAGLRSVTANILSDYAVKDMDLAGIKSLIACTPEDEVNATAAREFAHVLGRANVYQLARAEAKGAGTGRRTGAAAHLSARPAFRPALSHEELDEGVADGLVAKRTRLSEEFPLAAFRERYGEGAVVLFVLRGGTVEVVTPESKLPEHGVTVISLVPERRDAGPSSRDQSGEAAASSSSSASPE